MVARYNSPPGWPDPPEGWSPPPGWQPDPSWPAPPQGWQFWVDDAASPSDPSTSSFGASSTGAVPGGPEQPTQVFEQQPGGPEQPTQAFQQQPGRPDQQPTQAFGQVPPPGGQQPTQAMPSGGMYAYGPSGTMEQPGQSPYAAQHGAQPPGGYPQGAGYAGGAPPQGSNRRNPTVLIIAAVVGVLLVGGLVWGVAALVRGGGDDPDPTVAPTTDDPTTAEPTTDEPTTEEPTTEEPTDDPTTEEPTDSPTSGGELVDLTGSDPAIVTSAGGDPLAEIRLLSFEQNWTPGSGGMMCGEPENGEWLLVELEYTVLDAVADQDPPTYTDSGFSLGAEGPSGSFESNPFLGIFCLDAEDTVPTEMEPGETYSGYALLDVSDDVTAVTYSNFFDFSGTAPVYRWVLADQ